MHEHDQYVERAVGIASTTGTRQWMGSTDVIFIAVRLSGRRLGQRPAPLSPAKSRVCPGLEALRLYPSGPFTLKTLTASLGS